MSAQKRLSTLIALLLIVVSLTVSAVYGQEEEQTQDEAEALFSIERNVRPDCPEWREFFVDLIVDFLLWQQRPSGVLNEAQAEWLVGQADSARTLTAFATLVTALEEAHRTPGWFAAAVRGRVAKGWAGPEIARAA